MYNIKAKNNFFRRPDLSSDLRLQIAYKVLILHYWGIVTEMSKQYDVSRKFIYTLVNQLKQAQSFYYDVKQKSSQKIAKILFYKYMLSLRLEGKCPIQGISQVMKRFNLSYSSVGSISQSLYYFGSVVGNTLFSNDDTIRLIVFASDEIFSHSQPILITVDPVSSAILKVELSDSRKADVWVKHWQALKANNFEPLYLVSDSGISLCIAQELELSNTYRQPDTFHAVSHILGAWVTRLEAAAYKAINEEYWCEKILAIAKSDEVITKRKVKYKKSQEKSQEAITLYDSFSYLYICLISELRIFNSKGRVRNRKKSEENIVIGLELIETLVHIKITKAVKSIKKMVPYLLSYFDVAGKIVTSLSASDLPSELLEMLCLAWQSHRNMIKSKPLERKNKFKITENEILNMVKDELGETFSDVKNHIYYELTKIVQSSAMVECINSIYRTYLNVSRNHITQNMLNLIMFYHNHRRYLDGERKKKTPLELLTGKEQTKDWIELLFDKVKKVNPIFFIE